MTDILLYTDIGDDIDDTLALCYLLEYTNHTILAIITTHGDTTQRSKQAKKICKIYNKNIPIFTGSEKPIQKNHIPWYIPQLNQIIESNEHISVACIWPCTDLAYTYEHIPITQRHIEKIIYQGDTTSNWTIPDVIHAYNFKTDPKAALRCAQKIQVPQIYVSKQEAYSNPLTESDLQTFSHKQEISTYITTQAKKRYQKFKKLDPQKRSEIYGNRPWIISFPYDLVAVKKI